MTIKQQLAKEVSAALKDQGISDIAPKIEYPSDPAHGDYSTNAALVAAKKLGKNPMELAELIAQQLTIAEIASVDRLDVVKPGFINFSLSATFLTQKLQKSINSKFDFAAVGKGKKVVVEYSSPNIAKPFTIGHLRSTVIGNAVANLLEIVGYDVHRDNHVGDWGTQFGKQIYAIKTWGNEAELDQSGRPVKALVELYVKFHEEAEKDPTLEDEARLWFKKLEDGDPEARRLWQKCIDWSWKEFDQIYSQLGVEFTENEGRGYGEAFFEDKMQPVIDELREKELLREGKEGAQIVEFPEDSKLPPLMILKKDGATLYSTRDLATDKFRLETYGKDILIINEVGVEQGLYFRQLYELELMLGWFTREQRVHVKHGLIQLKDGKMSTRKGNTIWLEEVLEEAISRAKSLAKVGYPISETAQSYGDSDLISIKSSRSAREHTTGMLDVLKTARIVAIGAIKWNDLKRDSKQDILFDWKEILNMQGNAGPYMQYVYARTQSVIGKWQMANGKWQKENHKLLAISDKLAPEERELLRLLTRFDEVVEEAAMRFAPNILCTYLFELAQSFNLFYQKHQILKVEGEVRDFRLLLTQSTGEVIKKGLNLLGIEAPEKM